MRLIGKVENEKQAFVFYSFLLEQGIHSTYERQLDAEAQKERVAIWIYEEDQTEKASLFLQQFQENPEDERFTKLEFPSAPPQPPDLIAEQKEMKKSEKEKINLADKLQKQKGKARAYPITFFIIVLCVILYFWMTAQQVQMVKTGGRLALQIAFTPIQQVLMFDYPLENQKVDALVKEYPLKDYKNVNELPPNEKIKFIAAEKIPNWNGVMAFFIHWLKKKPDGPLNGPMFLKIRHGELWRLFTPCLLHGGFLHILFNMAWAWILVRQVEDRLSKWKTCLLILFIGIIANIAQYLMSGPYFLGFSGVVCGLVGFIWMRQKVAPWEGYPLHKVTIVFILIYVAAMFGLEIFSLVKNVFSQEDISANIANTAHIVGGISGILFGRLSFFSRGFR